MKQHTIWLLVGCGFLVAAVWGVVRETYGIPRLWPGWLYALGLPAAAFCFFQWWLWRSDDDGF